MKIVNFEWKNIHFTIFFFYFSGSRFGGEMHVPIAISNGACIRRKISYWRYKSADFCSCKYINNTFLSLAPIAYLWVVARNSFFVSILIAHIRCLQSVVIKIDTHLSDVRFSRRCCACERFLHIIATN